MDRDQIEEASVEAVAVLGFLELLETAVESGALAPVQSVTLDGLAASIWTAKRSLRRVSDALEAAQLASA